jgi:dihydroflavonol-4-reductase
MMKKTVLVTGISGFIAKHCAIELLNQGYSVRGTVRDIKKIDHVRKVLAHHADTTKLEFVEADLMSDSGWNDAMRDVWGVLHLASPFPLAQPKDENEVIRPAVEGTLRVLNAAIQNKVTRFVQTSSSVAIMYGHPHDRVAPFTESDWSDLNGQGITAYAKSKTLAEQSARALVSKSATSMHFATVNPGFVLGPLLDNDIGTSGEVIRSFLQGKYPGQPRLSFPVVDVRDIALMHRLALETAEPSGGRYIGVSEGVWFADMMRPIKAALGIKAKKVPTIVLPNFLMRIIALFDAGARSVLDDLGREVRVDNNQTRKALKMTFRPVTESAPAMAKSLIDLGLV